MQNIDKLFLKKNIKDLCIKLSKIFKLGYGGIDLKITKDDVFVLEINSVPSWKAIQKKISKINISEKLVKDFIRNIKEMKICLKSIYYQCCFEEMKGF